jgi:hypothetical protein
MTALSIEFTNVSDSLPCPDCGRSTHCVSGSVFWYDEKRAEYRIAWHQGEKNEGAHWLFVFADAWDADGPVGESEAVLLYFGSFEGKTGFGVIDADCAFSRKLAPKSALLPRERIAGTEFAREIFGVVDLIWENDDRIEEIREWFRQSQEATAPVPPPAGGQAQGER